MSPEGPRQYRVLPKDRRPLIDWMLAALRGSGCRIIHEPPPNRAPFRITFETPLGERLGIIAYAFYANNTLTKNRPTDEWRLQAKYGSKERKKADHEIWQDPHGLYVTLFIGINPTAGGKGFFVGVDPVLHSPTKLFISIEFKDEHVDEILKSGWHSWERRSFLPAERDEPRLEAPYETVVGGTAESFLRYIRFEREALGEDQGHRQLLADGFASAGSNLLVPSSIADVAAHPSTTRLHALAEEFQLSETEVLDLIASARRLKMAVRGWVAEEHLYRTLRKLPGVTDCARLDQEGSADIQLRYRGSRPLTVECKNILRKTTADGTRRLDFQRTRASKSDPCSRYYKPGDFDVIAACLHAVTLRWEFQYALPKTLDRFQLKCVDRIANNVRLDTRWLEPIEKILKGAAA